MVLQWRAKQWLSAKTRPLTSHPALFAIVVGVGATILCVVASWFFWVVWLRGVNQGSADTLGVQLSFASAVATFFTVFLAGALGFFAVREYHESHQRPNLYLFLTEELPETDGRGPRMHDDTLALSPQWVSEHGIDLWIANLSDVFASKYTIEVSIPHIKPTPVHQIETIEEVAGLFDTYCNPHLGELDQWSLFRRKVSPAEHELRYDRPEVERWIRLVGREGSELFPNVTTPFCTFFNVLYQEQDVDPIPTLIRFFYRIGIPGGPVTTGWLTVVFDDEAA
jgi:hypothetical protein